MRTCDTLRLVRFRKRQKRLGVFHLKAVFFRLLTMCADIKTDEVLVSIFTISVVDDMYIGMNELESERMPRARE